MSVTMSVTKPVTTTAPKTITAVFELVKSRKGNVFVTINGVKVHVFRADGYQNRLKNADKTAVAKTGFRHLPDGRVASPAA